MSTAGSASGDRNAGTPGVASRHAAPSCEAAVVGFWSLPVVGEVVGFSR